MNELRTMLESRIEGFRPDEIDGLRRTLARASRRERARRAGIVVLMIVLTSGATGAAWFAFRPITDLAQEDASCYVRTADERICITRTGPVVEFASGLEAGETWSLEGYMARLTNSESGSPYPSGGHAVCRLNQLGSTIGALCELIRGPGAHSAVGIPEEIYHREAGRPLDPGGFEGDGEPIEGVQNGPAQIWLWDQASGKQHQLIAWVPSETERVEILFSDRGFASNLYGPFQEVGPTVKLLVGFVPNEVLEEQDVSALLLIGYDGRDQPIWRFPKVEG